MSHIKQAPTAVVMVRPHHFTSNPQTMLDNTFQSTCNSQNQSQLAFDEVTNASKWRASYVPNVRRKQKVRISKRYY